MEEEIISIPPDSLITRWKRRLSVQAPTFESISSKASQRSFKSADLKQVRERENPKNKWFKLFKIRVVIERHSLKNVLNQSNIHLLLNDKVSY